MRRHRVAPLVAALAAAAICACSKGESPADGAPVVPANEVSAGGPVDSAGPGDVVLKVTKSPQRDGSFHGTGAMRTCGASSAGGKDFVASFRASASAASRPLQSLTFQSNELAAGGSTSSFKLYALLRRVDPATGDVKRLAPLAVQTGPSATGTARLTDAAGGRRLEVTATTDRGESIELRVSCGAR